MNLIEELNSFEIMESRHEGHEIVYVLIERTEENLKKLKALGATSEDLANMRAGDDLLDITEFAFRHCGADFYDQRNGFGTNLKCPKCGSPASIYRGLDGTFQIRCRRDLSCQYMSKWKKSVSAAIKNRKK